jgi:sugar phosphate isomerase/epimerase
MLTSRRDFLRLSALAGSTLLLKPDSIIEFIKKEGRFLDKIGVSTSLLNNEILAAAGYSYVEENVQEFLVPLEPDSDFLPKLSLIKESKLPVTACNTFLPGKLKSVGSSAVHEEILKYAEVAFRRAQMAGIKIIVLGSGGSRKIPEGFSSGQATEQFISLCKKMAPLARKYNVVVTLEPLNKNECNFINSLSEAGEIVKSVADKNFRLCADIYHMLVENESASDILKYGDLLHHVHIAEKTIRSAPGVNNEDFTQFFKALKNVNYNGMMTIECAWKDLQEQAPYSKSYLDKQIGTIL